MTNLIYDVISTGNNNNYYYVKIICCTRLIINIAATNDEDRTTVKPLVVPRVLARGAQAALEQFLSQPAVQEP